MLSEQLSKSVDIALNGLRALDVKSATALPAKVEQKKKELATITKQLDRASAELEAAEAKLAKLQAANQKQYDKEIVDKRAALEQASIDLEKANHQLGDTDAKIRDARVVESGLIHAIATLQARLQGSDELPATLIARLAGGDERK